ncbi:MAG: prepilin-type N-terminal cleavage/methylation domain-containing protein, partial [Desulfobacterales bacterium]|nr:prepilin-type N-terminal cleavage/methylation domain-containing protein [Desulfobacterales bacterium]
MSEGRGQMSEVRRQRSEQRRFSIRKAHSGSQIWNSFQAAGSRKPEASRRPAAGFTLMEVLVAIAILAIVVTTILASFNSVFSTTEVLGESADIYEM